MFSHVTRFGVAALAGLALLGPVVPQARAQRIVNPVNFNNAFQPNRNFYLNPYTSLRQQAYNTAVLGQSLSNLPPQVLGFPPYPPAFAPPFPLTNPLYN